MKEFSCITITVLLLLTVDFCEAGRRNRLSGRGGRGERAVAAGRKLPKQDKSFFGDDTESGGAGAFQVGKKSRGESLSVNAYAGKKGYGYGSTNDCDICKTEGKPEELTLTYSSNGQNSFYQGEEYASCREGEYPSSARVSVGGETIEVRDGETITVTTIKGAITSFEFLDDSSSDCFIHTSCSVPIVNGDQIGPWIVGDGEDECEPPTAPPTTKNCDICNSDGKKEKPEELTLTYSSNGQNSFYQGEDYASCREGDYPTSARVSVGGETIEVSDGETITIPVNGGAVTSFEFLDDSSSDDSSSDESSSDDSIRNCFIHTSCSVPIVNGDQIGPWIVGDGEDGCEPPPCVVCDRNNKKTVTELILRYNTDGMNSEYQGEGYASCRKGTYPDDTRVRVNGETFNLKNGEEFTITPDGGAETSFEFLDDDDEDCFIHTSCSVPIVPGDQIGPFEIIGDSDCKKKDEECISATVRTDDEDNVVIDVTFDYADLSMDRPFVDNCNDRDENCPITDLSPKRSDFIGFYPCDAALDKTPFSIEPTIWSYTCYDDIRNGKVGQCRREGDATAAATITFDDETVPVFGSQGVYSTIGEIMEKGGGCYIVLLNRINGFSAPPYYNICEGNTIEIPPMN